MQTFSFKKIADFVLDIVFPKKCVVCGKLDHLFCDDCRSKIILMKQQNCPFCLALTPRGRLCRHCRTKSALSGVTVLAHFEEPLKTVIYEYKYNFLKGLKADLAEIAWPLFSDFGDIFIVTCVPSSSQRLAWRGYNQAKEIAAILAKNSGLLFYPELLRRNKFRGPQTDLNRRERFRNVQDSFVINQKNNLIGKKIIIVDDLVTSGATLEACAKMLKKEGAKEVWGFTLARHR